MERVKSSNKIFNKINREVNPGDSCRRESESEKKEKERHIRNLFEDSDSDEDSDIPLTSSVHYSPPKNNIVIRRGLCFICTQNIYLTNVGIGCQKCRRTYHVQCLK